MSHSFEVSVLLFAVLKEAAGAGQITVHLEERDAQGTTVDKLLKACAQQHPAVAKWLPHVRVAVNCTYAAGAQNITAGDEIAFLPPVSGGAQLRA